MKHDGFICPVCGEEVPPNAAACPGCGSDEKTGWSDQTIYDGTGIEDPDEFDHDDWERRETDGRREFPGQRLWWFRGLALVVLLVWLLVWLFH